MKPARSLYKRKLASLVLGAALLCALPALAGCAGQHDGLYDDAQALAGADAYNTNTYIGKQTAPNRYEFSTSSLNGARTLWRYTTKEGREITVHCDLRETQGGDIKLVLVAPDGTVTTLVEATKDQQAASHTLTTGAGEYLIKVVGRGKVKAGAVVEIEGATGAFGS